MPKLGDSWEGVGGVEKGGSLYPLKVWNLSNTLGL